MSTYTYQETRIYMPELDTVFTITGTSDEVELAARSFHAKEVSTSKFDKLVYGRAYKHRFGWF